MKKKMTEIKKITKIALLAYGIVNLIYGPISLFFPEFFIGLGVTTAETNPYALRFGGATLLGIAIFSILIALKKNCVLQGEREMAAYNKTLGRFQLVGIPSRSFNLTTTNCGAVLTTA